jgi:hypothetical protein
MSRKKQTTLAEFGSARAYQIGIHLGNFCRSQLDNISQRVLI